MLDRRLGTVRLAVEQRAFYVAAIEVCDLRDGGMALMGRTREVLDGTAAAWLLDGGPLRGSRPPVEPLRWGRASAQLWPVLMSAEQEQEWRFVASVQRLRFRTWVKRSLDSWALGVLGADPLREVPSS